MDEPQEEPLDEPLIEFLLAGPRHRVYHLTRGSHLNMREFADRFKATGVVAAALRNKSALADKPDNPEVWKKLLATIDRTLHHGLAVTLQNPSRCKKFVHEGVDLYEWKVDHVRVFFFVEDPESTEVCQTLIVTHVDAAKKQDNTSPEEKARFVRLRATYYEWRDSLGARDAVEALKPYWHP